MHNWRFLYNTICVVLHTSVDPVEYNTLIFTDLLHLYITLHGSNNNNNNNN